MDESQFNVQYCSSVCQGEMRSHEIFQSDYQSPN